MADILETISNWAADLTWDDVPDGAKSRAADALRDTVATTVGGAPTGAAAIAIASGSPSKPQDAGATSP